MTLLHVIWSYPLRENDADTFLRGRVGVRISGDERIELKQLYGRALPADMILPVLNAALGQEWIDMAEKLHVSRKYPWQTGIRVGMSGARDYSLRVLLDSEWHNAPFVKSIHVSMYGNLNKGLSCWLGDLPPLLAKILEDHPPAKDYDLEVFQPSVGDGFHQDGESSGLKEILASYEAMEVLAE